MNSFLETNQIAKHYGRNFYDVVRKSADFEPIKLELGLVRDAIASNVGFAEFSGNLTIGNAEKTKFALAFAKACSLSNYSANLLKVLAENGRINLLGLVIGEFFAVDAVARGEVEVVVTSAHELNAKQKNNLQKSLEAVVGKSIILKSHLDESLLAGVKIRYGSVELDASASGKLATARKNLSSVIERTDIL